jgi:ferric iron reductase protein FhuF
MAGVGDKILEYLATLGPFFAVEGHDQTARPGLPWRPLTDLTTSADSMAHRITAVRQALGERGGMPDTAVELRVAASVTQLGLVARFVSPLLAALARGHAIAMPPDKVWWQDAIGGPVPLSIPVPSDRRVGSARSAAEVCHGLIVDLVEPVTATTALIGSVSRRVLWGNIASAVNGAALQVATARADLARASWRAAQVFFQRPELADERDSPGPGFRRSSCCLIYRLAPGAPPSICGDCVLTRPRT